MDQNLVKFSETSVAMADMKQRATGLVVKDVKDRAGLKKVQEVRKDIKATRVGLIKYAKDLKADALKYLRRINTELNPLVKEMEDLEAPLWAEEKRIAKEKEKLAEGRIQERIDQLGKYGVPFDYATIKKMSIPVFKKFLKEAKNTWERAEVERVAAEAKLLQQQKQLDMQQAELNKQKQPLEQLPLFPVDNLTEFNEPILSENPFPVLKQDGTPYFDQEKINDQLQLIKEETSKVLDYLMTVEYIATPTLTLSHFVESLNKFKLSLSELIFLLRAELSPKNMDSE